MPHEEQIHADKLGESGIVLWYRDCSIDRLEVMAQKSEEMLLKIMNE